MILRLKPISLYKALFATSHLGKETSYFLTKYDLLAHTEINKDFLIIEKWKC